MQFVLVPSALNEQHSICAFKESEIESDYQKSDNHNIGIKRQEREKLHESNNMSFRSTCDTHMTECILIMHGRVEGFYKDI